jgi:hypothetical protein
MNQKFIVGILCIVFLMTAIPINVSAYTVDNTKELLSVDIYYVFLFGRIVDYQKNDNFLSIKAKTVFIFDILFHGI